MSRKGRSKILKIKNDIIEDVNEILLRRSKVAKLAMLTI